MFSITFTFPKEYESDIKEYIAENGKDGIVEAIYKISRGGR